MANKHARISDPKTYLFDKPQNVKRLLRGFYAICGLLVALELVVHRHTYHDWENVPAFYALYGFMGCVVLVLVAKWMRTFLMRAEDYYDRDELGEACGRDDSRLNDSRLNDSREEAQ